MPVTHEQIAKRVGVSRAIVTRALHGTPGLRVSEETRREIEHVAKEMGYQPRHMTTRNIGLLAALEELQCQTDLNFANHVERVLQEKGYRLVLVNPNLPAGQEIDQILNSKTVDGVLVGEWGNGRHAFLLSQRLPCILLTEEDAAPAEIEQIGTDLSGSLAVLFQYLQTRGHRRAVFLSGTAISSTFYQRIERGARQAATATGFEASNLYVVNGRPQDAHVAVLELLKRPDPPSVVIASDEHRTLLVLTGLLRAGLRVPEDISIVSVFDSRILGMMQPAITATTAGGRALAEIAVGRILEKIATPETIPHHRFLAGELVERDSVASLLPSSHS